MKPLRVTCRPLANKKGYTVITQDGQKIRVLWSVEVPPVLRVEMLSPCCHSGHSFALDFSPCCQSCGEKGWTPYKWKRSTRMGEQIPVEHLENMLALMLQYWSYDALEAKFLSIKLADFLLAITRPLKYNQEKLDPIFYTI